MPDSNLSQALAAIPSGLYVLTARHGDEETGMLASWVMQAGFEPPAVTLAVRRDRYLADWLAGGCPLVLNILADENKPLVKHFARGFEPGTAAFAGLEIARCPRGVPVLPGTVGHLECTVIGSVDSGDHRVFLAEVVGGDKGPAAAPTVHLRKNGFSY